MYLEFWEWDHCEKKKTLSESHTKISEKLCLNNRLWFWHWTESA